MTRLTRVTVAIERLVLKPVLNRLLPVGAGRP